MTTISGTRVSKSIALAVGTAMIAIAGSSLATEAQIAQTTQPSMQPGMDRMKAPPAAIMNERSPRLSKILPGTHVVSPSGNKIGEVSGVEGALVIVSVGGILGVGKHHVALQKSQYEILGSGRRTQLRTTLSKQELEKMPKHTKKRM